MKNKIWICLLFSILFCAIGFLFLWFNSFLPINKSEKIHIAIAAPLTGKNKEQGIDMLKGINLYLDNLRNSGGEPKGKTIELIVYDDSSNENNASDVAIDIVSQKKALLVLGHLDSKTSVAAGNKYKRNEICAITASAINESVTLDNDWYFRIIPNNISQIHLIVNYIRKSMNMTSANVIYEKNSYGETMLKHFEKLSKRIGLQIKNKWEIDSSAENIHTTLEQIAKEAKSSKEIIFCAMSCKTAVNIIPLIKEKNEKQIIIGPDSLAKDEFIHAIKNIEEEKLTPGIFSNNIITVSPLIIDVSDKNAKRFKQSYINRFQKNPSLIAGCYYDAMRVAVEAIKKSNIQGKGHILSDRRKIKEALKSFYNYNHSIKGVSGRIYFHPKGDVIRLPYLGFYIKQKLLQNFEQYQPVFESDQIENFYEKALNGEIIVNNGHPMAKTSVVYTGIHIKEISKLDITNSKYTAEFYLWFRFKGVLDISLIEFLNAVNQVNLGQPLVDETFDNNNTKLFHAKAEFREDFDFHAYPFERHLLTIKLQYPVMKKKHLIFIADPIDLPKYYENVKYTNFHNKHWKLGQLSLYQNTLEKHSSLGNPKYFKTNNILNFSRLTAEIPLIRKDLKNVILKTYYPVFILIIFMIFIVFFELSSKYFNLSISALATFLVFNTFFYIITIFDLPTQAPAVDFVYFSIYGIIMIVFIAMLYNKNYKSDNGNEDKKDNHLFWNYLVKIVFLLLIFGIFFRLYTYATNLESQF